MLLNCFFPAGAACLKHAYNFIQAQKVIYVVFGLNAGFKTPDIFFTWSRGLFWVHGVAEFLY